MNKQRKLSTRIYALPRDKCVETTIAALADIGMRFIGQTEEDAKSTAGDLLRIFSNRLINSRRSGIIECGLSSLVEALQEIEPNKIILVQPFMSDRFAVTAFYDEVDDLVGYVTVDRLHRATVDPD
ncbi:hypothetical protein [Pseudoxanthomonas sacheonensis]|uniref:Uncharacterized protein n=1 Tax=Pseudoxanthomonas sacheonensis TaxID=443615 RepID=A0ABU1RRJ0_9GAMM|nr:hypothetical protein [Pseudoxanthomonas sacheonensis]MDR6841212.1 hypothetical protein [Pseudoxanthomonas sacheonensis]